RGFCTSRPRLDRYIACSASVTPALMPAICLHCYPAPRSPRSQPRFFAQSIMIEQLLKFFVTFLVVVEPVGVIPIFIAMTEGVAESERRRMARRGVIIAGCIFLLFA